MKENIVKAGLIGIGTIVAGTVAGITVKVLGDVANNNIKTNNKKEKEELERRLAEFEDRKGRARDLEIAKNKRYREMEKELESITEEVDKLKKIKKGLEDEDSLLALISVLIGDMNYVKSELAEVKTELKCANK